MKEKQNRKKMTFASCAQTLIDRMPTSDDGMCVKENICKSFSSSCVFALAGRKNQMLKMHFLHGCCTNGNRELMHSTAHMHACIVVDRTNASWRTHGRTQRNRSKENCRTRTLQSNTISTNTQCIHNRALCKLLMLRIVLCGVCFCQKR